MEDPLNVPAWLLSQLFLKNGVFNHDKTAVISGIAAPRSFAIDLTKRPDWEAVRKRLADEEF